MAPSGLKKALVSRGCEVGLTRNECNSDPLRSAGLVTDQILQRTEDRIVPEMVEQLVEVPKMMSHIEPSDGLPSRSSTLQLLSSRSGVL